MRDMGTQGRRPTESVAAGCGCEPRYAATAVLRSRAGDAVLTLANFVILNRGCVLICKFGAWCARIGALSLARRVWRAAAARSRCGHRPHGRRVPPFPSRPSPAHSFSGARARLAAGGTGAGSSVRAKAGAGLACAGHHPRAVHVAERAVLPALNAWIGAVGTPSPHTAPGGCPATSTAQIVTTPVGTGRPSRLRSARPRCRRRWWCRSGRRSWRCGSAATVRGLRR